MPRWAEGIGLLVAALVILGAILVYAKFTTQQQRSKAAATAEETAAALRESAAIPDAPATTPAPPPADAEAALRAANAAAAQVTVTVRAPQARPPVASAAPRPAAEPLVGPPLAAANLDTRPAEPFTGPPLAGRGDLPPLTAEQAAALVAAEGATEAEVQEVAAKAAPPAAGPVASGSKEELALIEQAHASLVRLHNLKLRTDLPPAQAQAEAERLSGILGRLPAETRQEVQALIDQGYNQRVAGPRATGNLDDSAAAPTDLRSRELGRYDDTPNDVQALRQRVDALRRATGVRARPGGPPPAVNPSRLPSARPSSLNGSQGGGLPEAGASDL